MATKPAAKSKSAAPSKSTAVARAKIALPANAAEIEAAEVAALGDKLAAPTGRTILVTQSKEFKFPDGTKVDSFKGVIVAFGAMNAYYEGEFDRDNIVPPNCFAVGVVKNDDLIASEKSPDPQNAEDGGACATCWANQWKSAPKGNGKACKNSIKLAILCHDGEVRPMGLSATALKPFGDYVREIVETYGKAPSAVLTEFSFADSDWSSVRCGNAMLLDDDQRALVFAKKDEALAILLQEPDTSEFEEKVVAKRDKPKAGKKAAGTSSRARARA